MSAGAAGEAGGRGPLAGLRILEFVGLGAAPFAGMILSDMGAEILRIDRPGAKPMLPDPVVGRGRPTVEADLKTAEDRDAVCALAERADAVFEGFRPGVMERLGLGPDQLMARNPRLVYGRMTGWGQDGPLAPRAGHDINYIAITGALAAIGPAERPVPPLNLVGDFGGGAMYLVAGMLAALLSAQRTGRGQVVDAAMADGAVSLMSMFCELSASGLWRDRREANLLDGGAPFYGVYECADGLHVAVGAIEPQFHAELIAGLGFAPEDFSARDDPAEWPRLRRLMAERIRSRKRAEWLALLEDTDACFAPVVPLREAPSHPHLAARGSFIELDGVTQPAPAPRFSGTPARVEPAQRRVIGLSEAAELWR